MLRNGLLITTALIIVGSISFAAAQSAKISRGRWGGIAIAAAAGEAGLVSTPDVPGLLSNPGRDRNGDFLCTYGYEVYNDLHHFSGGATSFHWQHYAVPIRGNGASVTQIIVTDSPLVGRAGFEVGIYYDAHGRPGTLAAGGKGKALGSCRLSTVVIPKTFLVAGQKYWVEENSLYNESSPPGQGHSNKISWGHKPKARHNALHQYYSFSSCDIPASDRVQPQGTQRRQGAETTADVRGNGRSLLKSRVRPACSYSYLSDWLPVSGPGPFVKVE